MNWKTLILIAGLTLVVNLAACSNSPTGTTEATPSASPAGDAMKKEGDAMKAGDAMQQEGSAMKEGDAMKAGDAMKKDDAMKAGDAMKNETPK